MVAMMELALFLHKRVLLMTKKMNLQYYPLILYQNGRSQHIKNISNKKTRRREKEKKREKETKEKRKKEKRNQGKLLPTAKNRTGNLPSRVAGQHLYHDVFSTYRCHFVQNDIYPLKDVIQDIMTTSSSLPKRCTIGPPAQLNSMVSSWTTNGKATTAGSLLVFEDNVSEDELSSQSTYKVNIDCLFYKASIAFNPKVLNDLKPSKEQLEKVYGGIIRMNRGCKMIVKNLFLH